MFAHGGLLLHMGGLGKPVIPNRRIIGFESQDEFNFLFCDLSRSRSVRLPKDFFYGSEALSLFFGEVLCDQRAVRAPKVIDAISAILPYVYLSVRIGDFVDDLCAHDAYSSVK